MSLNKDSKVLSMLQPDLLTVEELIEIIQSRCKIKNLGFMSKEGLVGLFRRVILPLPQRFYRTNRRGKMLTSRRAKTARENRRKEKGFSREEVCSRGFEGNSRLKPPPDMSTCHRIRISFDKSEDSNDMVIRDKKKLSGDDATEEKDAKIPRSKSPSGRKVTLKRPSGDEKSSSQSMSPTERKIQRTAIKWP